MWAGYYGEVDDIALDAIKRLDGAVSPEVWGSLRELDPIEEFTHARDYLLREVDRP